MYGSHEYLVLKLVEQRLADARTAAKEANAVRAARTTNRRPRVQVVVRARRRVLFRLAF